jgi:hypothetical protein
MDNDNEKYILVMGNKSYCEATDSFQSDEKAAKRFDTYSEASNKKKKLYKKIFGNISIKIVHE